MMHKNAFVNRENLGYLFHLYRYDVQSMSILLRLSLCLIDWQNRRTSRERDSWEIFATTHETRFFLGAFECEHLNAMNMRKLKNVAEWEMGEILQVD